MNILCAVFSAFYYLTEKKTELLRRAKKAVFVTGTAMVITMAFSSQQVSAKGEAQVREAGLKSIIQGVFVSQNTQTEVKKIGTAFEVVLVGQRMGKREIESQLDFSSQGVKDVELLKDKSIGFTEDRLVMSDEDYNTLLKIVEAEAGGEDLKGKILVANVIFNRVKSPEFPSTVTEVVWENVAGSPQFSPTADGRIHTVTVSEETREAVNRAIDGEDYSEGALFFVEEAYADKSNVKWFKEDLKFLFKHGVHDFYTYP